MLCAWARLVCPAFVKIRRFGQDTALAVFRFPVKLSLYVTFVNPLDTPFSTFWGIFSFANGSKKFYFSREIAPLPAP